MMVVTVPVVQSVVVVIVGVIVVDAAHLSRRLHP